MDWPMFYKGNSVEAAPEMIFFIHIILANSDSQRAMTLGQTVRVTQTGCERLSRLPLELVVT
jgi:Xaa-Pro dipeptidase